MRRGLAGLVAVGVGAVAAVGASSLTPAGVAAALGPSVIYVSPTGSSSGDDSSCGAASHNSVQSAVDDLAEGGTVYVCAGTYKESVRITKTLMLRGIGSPVIDATGQAFGIGIGADFVTVRGMTVKNAADPGSGGAGDGIQTRISGADFNYATLANNVLIDNGRGAGAGIDIGSSHGTVVTGNTATGNYYGIRIDCASQPPYGSVVSNNSTAHSVGSGILLDEEGGCHLQNNVVVGNVSLFNGGSGIYFEVCCGGGRSMRDNVVRGNTVYGNDLAGITVRLDVEGGSFDGNRIVGNVVGNNHLVRNPSIGIYIASSTSVALTVARNLIYRNAFGIFTAGLVRLNSSGNTFTTVDKPYYHRRCYWGHCS